MPLIKGKSSKAFEHNLKAEMHAGKPQNQALAIAYSVKRKASKKKMADGGITKKEQKARDVERSLKFERGPEKGVNTHSMEQGTYSSANAYKEAKSPTGMYSHLSEENRHAVAERNKQFMKKRHEHVLEESKSIKPKLKGLAEGGAVSASNESRPHPDERHNDAHEIARNAAKKALVDAQATDRPELRQSRKGLKTTPIKHPRMVHSDVLQARLRSEEDDLMQSAHPASPDQQPPREDDEEGANRQGPALHDMEHEHSTHRRPYAKGGEIEASDEHPHENQYEDDLTDLHPSEDEGAMDAHMHNEEGPDRQGPDLSDDEEPHSEHDLMYSDNARQARMSHAYAHGGLAHEMDEQPEHEAEDEHDSSIAAAIMAKRHKYARGGAILSEDAMDSDDSDQADLERNAEEDANLEDKASFDALRKENYSESDALEDLTQPEDSNEHSPEHEDEDVNDHSIVSSIRRKMKSRSPITR